MTGRAAIAFAVAALAIVGASGACAQTQSDPGEIHGLKLGLAAQAMTLDGWGQLACGSDGGPPRQELDAWSDFKKCRPEASGLREVAARFDDEDEYVAKALGEPVTRGGRPARGSPAIPSFSRPCLTTAGYCAAFAW